jgi:hypothetical protein
MRVSIGITRGDAFFQIICGTVGWRLPRATLVKPLDPGTHQAWVM